MVQAILVLYHVENPTYQAGKRSTLVMSCRARTRHTYDGHDEAEG